MELERSGAREVVRRDDKEVDGKPRGKADEGGEADGAVRAVQCERKAGEGGAEGDVFAAEGGEAEGDDPGDGAALVEKIERDAQRQKGQ